VEFVDQASAKDTKHRPEFRKMMAAASRREFDVVLFWSLDRLSREGSSKTTLILNELDGYGIQWKSFTEQYLDTCGIFKEMVISLLATLARQERERLRERVKAGMQRYKQDWESGKIGTVKTSGSGRNLSIGRQRRIFDRQKAVDLKNQGKSVREIAKELKISIGTAHKAIRYRSSNSEAISS